jgi:hypothetical protein
MNVEIGNEATQFNFWEYINRIFFAMWQFTKYSPYIQVFAKYCPATQMFTVGSPGNFSF